MIIENKFTFRFYFQTMTRVLGEPRKFFIEIPEDITLKTPVCFLLVSSIFFSIANLLSAPYTSPLMTGSIFFINAVGMTLIATVLGYMVMTMITDRQVTFAKFFSIYVFSSGVTLLASWIPIFFFITEPWKWWLIWTGLVKGCGFTWWRALLIIGLSITIIVLFFYSLTLFFQITGCKF